MKNPTDEELVKKAKAGDSAAFGLLVLRYQRDIYELAFHYLRNSADAEDLSQETFIEAYSNLHNLQEPAKFARWLRSIAKHLSISWLRRRHKIVSYEEVMYEGMYEVQITEAFSMSRHALTPDELLERKELRQNIMAAIESLPEKNRLAISLHYLDGMSYKEIANLLKVSITTIEGRLYRARKKLKEEMIKMTKEVMGTSEIESKFAEVHNQMADLQKDLANLQTQMSVFIHEVESSALHSEKKAAFDTICRLPSDAENPITWGFAGAYRYGNTPKKSRGSFLSQSIDEYLDAATDSDVADFAKIFTDPIAINVIKQLMESQKSVAELAKECEVSESEMNHALDSLITADLVHREEGDLIVVEFNAITYILTLLNMTRLYNENLKPQYGNEVSRIIMTQVAQDLAKDVSHLPPMEAFNQFPGSAGIITLFQAIPLSLSREKLESIKKGERLSVAELNSAQQEYLRAVIATLSKQPKDFSSITLSIGIGHRKGEEDHSHLVIEADSGSFSYRIDAFLAGTARPDWY